MKNKIRIEFDKIPKAFLAATHEVVQKKLFELGYEWVIDGAKVGNYYDFLWAYGDGIITFGDDRTAEGSDNPVKPENVYVMPDDFDKWLNICLKKNLGRKLS